MKDNKTLITEGIEGIKSLLSNTDILELEVTSSLRVGRTHNVWSGILAELDKVSITEGIFYKHLSNGNMLVVKNIKHLDYAN